MGKVEEVAIAKDDVGWGRSLRFQVAINIYKPLARGKLWCYQAGPAGFHLNMKSFQFFVTGVDVSFTINITRKRRQHGDRG